MFDYGREELEAEYNARYDYYSEAYGAEARLMDRQNMLEIEDWNRQEALRLAKAVRRGRGMPYHGPAKGPKDFGCKRHPVSCDCLACDPF